MQKENLKQLKGAIENNSLLPLYLFWGEEDYLRDFYVKKIRETILPKGLEELNHFRFGGKDINLDELSNAIDTVPAFCEKKLIEIHDFDFYKHGKRDELDQILGNLPDYSCLLFVFSDPNFKPDGRMKIHKHFKTTGLSVEFPKQEGSDLFPWIRRRFEALEKEIDRPTIEFMAFYCGVKMTNLIGEIEKVAAFIKTKQVTKEDITQVCTPHLDAVIWNFTDALAEQNFQKASGIMGDLFLMRENPILILAATGKKLRQLYSACLLIEGGKGDALYLKKLWGLSHEYPAKLLLQSGKKLNFHWCKQAVLLAAESDLQMKSTGRNGEEILVDFLLSLKNISLKGKGRA